MGIDILVAKLNTHPNAGLPNRWKHLVVWLVMFDYYWENPSTFEGRFPVSEMQFHYISDPQPNTAPGRGWRWARHSDNQRTVSQLQIPCWFTTLVAAACASCAVQLPRQNRFSLRTLLIATTLVAVVLGLVVWASR